VEAQRVLVNELALQGTCLSRETRAFLQPDTLLRLASLRSHNTRMPYGAAAGNAMHNPEQVQGTNLRNTANAVWGIGELVTAGVKVWQRRVRHGAHQSPS
jgi:hypothetical protein